MTQPPENIIVEAEDISFSYPDRQDRYVLNKLNLQVPKVVFMPIIVVMLGIGDSSKICLIFLAIFFSDYDHYPGQYCGD